MTRKHIVASEELWRAVVANDLRRVKAALADDAGFNIKRRHPDGGFMNALEAALFKKTSPTILKLLIKNYGDINRVGSDNRSPLAYACDWGSDRETVQIILKRSPKFQDGKKYNALYFALRRSTADVVKLLIDSGAPIDFDIEEINALELTATRSSRRMKDHTWKTIIQLFLDAGLAIRKIHIHYELSGGHPIVDKLCLIRNYKLPNVAISLATLKNYERSIQLREQITEFEQMMRSKQENQKITGALKYKIASAPESKKRMVM